MDFLFKIHIDDLFWINGTKDDPKDMCLHGIMSVVVGGRKLAQHEEFTVSASALYFLKTLTEDHILNEDNQMLPCCGHYIVPMKMEKMLPFTVARKGLTGLCSMWAGWLW